MKEIRHSRIVFLLLGMLGGYIILHPYTMLAYALLQNHESLVLNLQLKELRLQTLTAFSSLMFPMSISFVFFGGLAGLLFGILIERKKRLVTSEYENEKKKIVLDTMKELMVTLSHHLLNANTIIGGEVRHLRKTTPTKDDLNALEIIEEQGRKIDAAVRSLREVTEIKTASYTTSGSVKMLDITREIEERIMQ